MQVYNTQRQGTAPTALGHGSLTYVPDVRHESNRRLDQSAFESQNAFQPKLCSLIKTYCVLSNTCSPQFVHIEVIKSDGTIVRASAIPVPI